MTYNEVVQKFTNQPETMRMGGGKLSKRFKISVEEIQRAKDEVRSLLKQGVVSDFGGKVEGVTSFQEDIENKTAQLTARLDREIQTLDELIERCKIDTDTWDITKYVQNYWGNVNDPHWQVKAFLSAKKELESDIITDLLESYKSKYQPLTKEQVLQNETYLRKKLLLVSMADFHLDKRTLDGKTLEEKVELYDKILSKLVYSAYGSHRLDEICYLISNDFLHTDNYQESTTRGTPQQSSTSWHNAYEVGFDVQVKAISKLKQFCTTLRVIHVPSNHSRTKEYYMAHALEVYFKPDANIIFDRTAEPTKAITYGNTFIGMHHGDVRDYNQLPTYFASKFRKQWGESKFTEIALADKHHRKEWKHSLTKNEIHGTRMFICPSLSGADTWHKDSLFDLAIPASVARIYDFETGYCGELEARI